MRLLLTAIAIIATFLYCRKENKAEIDFDALINCADDQYTDSTLIAGRMVGTWKLISQVCPMGSNQTEDVQVTFTTGRHFEILKNGTVINQGNWRFNEWGSGWSLDTGPFNLYLFGSISFCNSKLIFSGMQVDGCNHYFRRIL